MTKQQRAYAAERAKGILDDHLDRLREKYTTEGQQLSKEEVKDRIYNGDGFLIRSLSRYTYGSDKNRWNVKVEVHDEVPETFDEKRYHLEASAYEKEFRRVTDELFLGDAERALELIKAFEGMDGND